MIEDYSPKKIMVEKEIFHKINYNIPFTWKDIKHLDLQDDDLIKIEYVEPYYSENNSWDGHYSCTITRMVEETDEEFDARQERIKWDKKWSRERQFQNFLTLKKKFTKALFFKKCFVNLYSQHFNNNITTKKYNNEIDKKHRCSSKEFSVSSK